MRNTKLALFGIFFTTISLFFLIAQTATAETYMIGSSLAITGPTSDAGSPYAKGIEDYCKFTNDMKLAIQEFLLPQSLF